LLELPRQRRLVDLPCERALVRTARVLDELLGDRRAALNALTTRDVGPDGTGDPAQVETAVLIEALVLHGDDRLLHHGRDLTGADDHARLRAAQDGEDGMTVVGVDVAVDLGVLLRGVATGDLAGHCHDEAVRERGDAEQAHDQEKGEDPEFADPAALGRLLPSSEEPQRRGIVTLAHQWASRS